MAGDMHTHTTFSDGGLQINDLIVHAQNLNLDYLAITDHDTFLAYDYIDENREKYKIHLIQGVELSCMDTKRNRKVHILCYFPNKTTELQNYFKKINDSRNNKIQNNLEILKKLYPCITDEKINAKKQDSKTWFKSHVMDILVDYAYTDKLYGDLFKELFGRNGKCKTGYIDYLDIYDLLEIAHNSKGVVVMAHPSVYNSMELVKELTDKKLLDGIEVYHPRNTLEDIKILEQIVEKNNLLKTAGSDFHGRISSKPVPLGSFTIENNLIEKLIKFSQEKHLAK